MIIPAQPGWAIQPEGHDKPMPIIAWEIDTDEDDGIDEFDPIPITRRGREYRGIDDSVDPPWFFYNGERA